jgi:hypothetical protein
LPLNVTTVNVDADCEGERWDVHSEEYLTKVIAIVAIGQAKHAAEIIRTLIPAEPVFKNINVFTAARDQLQINGSNDTQRVSSMWSRDGFIFEVISWIAIQKTSPQNSLMKTPHIKSTTQGLDGLLLEIANVPPEIMRATICEDKCSQNPRKIFRDKVLASFKNHHAGKRAPELVAEAASLLEKLQLNGTEASKAASRVLDIGIRRYRAALAIEEECDSIEKRKKLFKNFAKLDKITQSQRLAATFVVKGTLREYFNRLATAAIRLLDTWEKGEV